jgi:hypothetical protein
MPSFAPLKLLNECAIHSLEKIGQVANSSSFSLSFFPQAELFVG